MVERGQSRDITISRRDLVKKVGIVTAVVAGAGYVESRVVENKTRSQFLEVGDLAPELEQKLETANYTTYETQGWTVNRMRTVGIDVPAYPYPIAEGESDPEEVASTYNWIGVGENGVYLSRDEETNVGDLSSNVNSESRTVKRIDDNLQFEAGNVIDFLEADLAHIRNTGETIFQAGHVATTHTVDVEGVTNGIAIGRSEPNGPLSYITFDASDRDTLLPNDVSPGGLVVSDL